jgi:hypothetical protein
MTRYCRVLAKLACATLLTGLVFGQTQPRTPEQQGTYRKAMETADQQIADEVRSHSELVKNLEYLTTQIGARLTGSPQMQRASEWTLQRFKDYGVDAHLETGSIDHAWTRGEESAEITSPIHRSVGIHAFGWSRATAGSVAANVVAIEARELADLEAYRGKLKGAIVLVNKPTDIAKLDPNPENAYDAVVPLPRGIRPAGAPWVERGKIMRQLADEQPALLLLDSGKPDSLFNMGGSFPPYNPSKVPQAFLTHEEYDLIWRLRQTGPVTLRVNLQNTFSEKPVPVSITVAEIKGSELPDERVILGGHLDSWDLGQGALDNGTGAMAVLEAARTLQALGWKPKRTLTFVLFTGEEQGGTGVDTYLKNHAAELPRTDAVLIHDIGTGRVTSIALQNLWETGPLMSEIYLPLQEVFDLQSISTRSIVGSDHDQYLDKGVPAYFCLQVPAHYREAHHSQADTFDKVIPDQINQGAALLAAWAWNVSEMPSPLPHHPEIKSQE